MDDSTARRDRARRRDGREAVPDLSRSRPAGPATCASTRRSAADPTGPDRYLAGTVRSLLPFLEQIGAVTAAEVDIDTLEARLRDEVVPSTASRSCHCYSAPGPTPNARATQTPAGIDVRLWVTLGRLPGGGVRPRPPGNGVGGLNPGDADGFDWIEATARRQGDLVADAARTSRPPGFDSIGVVGGHRVRVRWRARGALPVEERRISSWSRVTSKAVAATGGSPLAAASVR